MLLRKVNPKSYAQIEQYEDDIIILQFFIALAASLSTEIWRHHIFVMDRTLSTEKFCLTFFLTKIIADNNQISISA